MKHLLKTTILLLSITGMAYAHGGAKHNAKKDTAKVEQQASEKAEAHDHSAHEHADANPFCE